MPVTFVAWPFQYEDLLHMLNAWMKGKNGVLNANPMGAGKAQPLDANVLTPTGWTTMGDLSVGSEVIGRNGHATKVTGIYPQGKQSVFKVTFSDGFSTECTDEHLWSVITPTRKFEGSDYRTTQLKDLGSLKDRQGNSRHFIPIVEPVRFAPKLTHLDPYLLGLILGDGCFRGSGGVSLSTADAEIVESVINTLPSDMEIKKRSGSKYDYNLVSNIQRFNPVVRSLKAYGLYGKKSENKHIPDEYKYNTVPVRFALLQGLMDTDGTATKSGASFSSSSKQLAYDVAEIVQSLGGIARVQTKKTTHLLHYRVNVSLPVNPFRLARKANSYIGKTKYLPHRSIISIEQVVDKECQCIKVEAPDSLYVTDSYIVTHNTMETSAAESLISSLQAAKDIQPMSLWLTKKSLRKSTAKEIRRWIPDRNLVVLDGDKATRKIQVQLAVASGSMLIANYDSLATTPEILETPWTIVVADECHKLKGGANPSGPTKVWKLVKKLVEQLQAREGFFIPLSGSPVQNHPREMWSLLTPVQA